MTDMKRTAFIASGAVLLAACAPLTSASAATTGTVAVGHRGGTEGAVENTRNAWNYSMRHGVRNLETDVRFTRDGVPVIMHDDTVNRVTNGSGSVSSMTLAKLRTYRTADRQYVPTLYEFLTDAKRYGAHTFVELKVTPTAAQWVAFDARFRWLGVKGSTVVVSFDKPRLLAAKSRGYATGWIDELGDRNPAQILPYGSIYFKHQWSVTAARAAKWKAAGIKVYAWTSDKPADWKRFKSYPIAGVVTNRPVGASL